MKRLIVVLLMGMLALTVSAQQVEWTFELETPASAPTLYPNAEKPTGMVVCSGNEIIRIDGHGKDIWRRQVEPGTGSPPTVADLDGDGSPEILVLTLDGSIVCFDASGDERWRRDYNTPTGGFKSIVAADVHTSPGLELLFGFDDGWLRCLAADGSTLWDFFGDKYRVGGITVGDADGDGSAEVVYGTDNGHVYCLNGGGLVEWRYAETAPFGRSGPNLADLDNDGDAEILISLSNVNNDTRLTALDGRTGKRLWRSTDIQQGYVSNAVADLDGDGDFEVLHGDKGNNLYAENGNGSRAWHAELNGRGIFFAPAVADLDGDGALEIVPALRGEDPDTGTNVFVVGADGKVKAKLDYGSDANASPAVGDIDGDGELELLLSVQGPNALKCITWNAAGEVAWPSYQGDSAMTGRTNVAAGQPSAAPASVKTGNAALVNDEAFLGGNAWNLSWSQPVVESACVELSVVDSEGVRTTWIQDLKAGATSVALDWELLSGEPSTVSVRLFDGASAEPVYVDARAVQAKPATDMDVPKLEERVAAALDAGRKAGVDVSGLLARKLALDAAVAALEHQTSAGADNALIAQNATALRRRARDLAALTNTLGRYWADGGTAPFLAWVDNNPWDAFDPKAPPEEIGGDSISFTAYMNEFEDAAVTIFNSSAETLDVRVGFREPKVEQGQPGPEPDLARHFTLRRNVPVPSHFEPAVFDALPEMDLSRSLTIPPGEARQVWLVVKTHGLGPGRHELPFYIAPLAKPLHVKNMPVTVDVWPVELPVHVYSKINWSNLSPSYASDQCLQDMIDHGINVTYGPPMPGISVDAQGHLAGEIDWTGFDAVLARVPGYWTFLWGSPPARRWPEGVAPEEDSPAYFQGFKTAVDALARHMEEKGFGYRQWAFYPVDEPWNTGFAHVPHLKHFAEMVKKANPQAQVYTDPAGLVRVQYLEEFKDLIDIWQPEMNTLKRDPALVEWFAEHSTRFWAYEAPGPAKDFKPIGHYRGFAWLAWHFGLEGAGYWVYKVNDIWWHVEGGDWSIAYQTGSDVVPSRRWEADRDGVEDYRAFYVLRREIDRVRGLGHGRAADEAQALLDQAVEDIIGWQVDTIDEITRFTRDYEIDYALLLDYRTKIAEKIIQLQQMQ
ncbi:MAG: PQQ-binding-like beta-propeller repeat protein [Candidatus Hydrogenedentes bacterium]|nr:PQQ-binding-like beta-propeller repeat protein [Candidatus Hydrogenedentota bacterium]